MLSLYSNLLNPIYNIGYISVCQMKECASCMWFLGHGSLSLTRIGNLSQKFGCLWCCMYCWKRKGIKWYPHWIGNPKHVLLSLFQLFLLKSILSEDGALFLAYWDDYFKWLLSCRKNFKWHSSKLHTARISFWTG